MVVSEKAPESGENWTKLHQDNLASSFDRRLAWVPPRFDTD